VAAISEGASSGSGIFMAEIIWAKDFEMVDGPPMRQSLVFSAELSPGWRSAAVKRSRQLS
jgi:hypothetical protein